VERIPEGQPGEHPDPRVPGDRVGGVAHLQPAACECQTRIQQKRWCPHCEREVPLSEVVKGYEFAKGRYVVMQEDDFAKVSTPSTRIINLEQFTDETAVDPDVRGSRLLPGAGWAGGRRRLRGDARRHARQGGHRQGGACTGASIWSLSRRSSTAW
jgi:hypothetical protein